jgi:cytochrome c oxidase accessory protein FixG
MRSVAASNPPEGEVPLYADRQKVYPRRVGGPFRVAKWAVLGACLAVYYGLPWLRWDRGPNLPGQAVLADMGNARLYFFWIEVWPQEIYLLTGLLVLGALALFLATSLFGRIWCGYACPQTVWTDLFMLVERWIEGDRNARMKLDAAPVSPGKVARKGLKHGVWLLIAAATGGAWIFYFNDAPTAFADLFGGRLGFGTYFFFGLFTATTYVLAGWAREQVCTYMCPWPRFQAAMLDEHSLAVTYQAWRGEPRGKLHRDDPGPRGDCIDCLACVHVCPTGIDIRDGLQLECIGCGLCIDACDDMMVKVGRPTRLVAFTTQSAQTARQAGTAPAPVRWLRARTLVYAAMLALVAVLMAGALWLRVPTHLSVLPDRSPLFVRLSDGSVRNAYTVRVTNRERTDQTYVLATDLAGADIALLGGEGRGISVAADSVATFRVQVRMPRGTLGNHAYDLRLLDAGGRDVARRETHFVGPER